MVIYSDSSIVLASQNKIVTEQNLGHSSTERGNPIETRVNGIVKVQVASDIVCSLSLLDPCQSTLRDSPSGCPFLRRQRLHHKKPRKANQLASMETSFSSWAHPVLILNNLLT
jgi:hypothetical protein